MLNDFPMTTPPCSLHQGEQCLLVQCLDLAFEQIHGVGPTTNKPTSQMYRLWGNSIILIAPKCHKNLGIHVGRN